MARNVRDVGGGSKSTVISWMSDLASADLLRKNIYIIYDVQVHTIYNLLIYILIELKEKQETSKNKCECEDYDL